MADLIHHHYYSYDHDVEHCAQERFRTVTQLYFIRH